MIGLTLIQIGTFRVYTHGFFLMLGVICAGIVLFLLVNKFNFNKGVIFDLIIYTLLFGIIGARITYFLLYSNQFTSLFDLFKIWQGGLVSWGGFILGIGAAVIVVKMYKEKVLPWLDILLISSLLGLAIGRLGSFLSGELAGLPYSGLLSISGMHPVTLYEAIYDLIIFVVLIIVYSKYKNLLNPGILALDVLILYSFGRFLIDFFRTESVFAFGLSLGQIFSAFILVISIVMFFIIIMKNRRATNDIT